MLSQSLLYCIVWVIETPKGIFFSEYFLWLDESMDGYEGPAVLVPLALCLIELEYLPVLNNSDYLLIF